MTFETILAAQKTLATAGSKPLGSLLWWSLNGNRIDHDRLEDVAARHNLDTKYLPKELKPTQVFRRGCRHAGAKLPHGMMLRPIADTSDELIVGLVQERVTETTRELDYDLVTRIEFDKHSARITADVENGVVSVVKQLYRHHLAHTTEDIRGMLATFLREAGVSLRESGGVYFVPATHQTTLDALCAVVEEAGRNATFQLPIVDTAGSKKTLRQVAKRSLDDEIRQLHAELQRFDRDKVRQSTLERKLDGFEDLRSRVNLFARVLSFKADALNNKISSIQAALRGQLQIQSASVSVHDAPVAAVAAAVDVGF